MHNTSKQETAIPGTQTNNFFGDKLLSRMYTIIAHLALPESEYDVSTYEVASSKGAVSLPDTKIRRPVAGLGTKLQWIL